MDNKVDVSVIIVNYNTLKMTNECINSIVQFTKNVNYEIILIDNSSTDGSREFFSSDDRILYIYNTDNLGFGKANNLGLKSAKGKYIFFLNSDTLLLNDAISIFFEKIENTEENVCCLGAELLDLQRKRTHSYGNFPNFWGELVHNTFLNNILLQTNILKSPYDDPSCEKGSFFKVDYITGADLFVRRETIDRYGAFDPGFFMYYEESEMQKRYSKQKCYSYILKGPKIIHLEGASTKNSRPSLKKRMMSIRGCLLYFKKTESYFIYKLFKTFLILLSLPNLLNRKYLLTDRKNYIKVLIK